MNVDPKTYPLLSCALTPGDLKKLPSEKLESLCAELRDFLLKSVSKSSGHLASGLGVVELTVALHYVYDTPQDQIVWDVGHQAYPHKILTGRASELETIRRRNGLHSFPWRDESEYDPVSVGHASTSVGMALGMSVANTLKGLENRTVAVLGDGALTGGMVYEAMNQAGGLKANMLVVLNDNENSISSTVGALSTTLSNFIASPLYNDLSSRANSVLENFPLIKKLANKTGEHVKGMVLPSTLFEELGFNYVGPIDGHNVNGLVEMLQKLKSLKGPQLLHIVTQKGKGYEPAEHNPSLYHGVPQFQLDHELPQNNKKSYSSVFGQFLMEQAQKDPLMVAVTPAMKDGSGMAEFAEKYPDRFFDVAIAEQHAITFSGGMAINGLHPIVCVYSSFLQRAYDQIIHDIAIQNTSVVIAVDRAGIVGADGPTHQGIFDIAYLRTVPNLTILAPSCFEELTRMLEYASRFEGSVAIRYPRGGELGVSRSGYGPLETGRGQVVRNGDHIVIMNFGALLSYALDAGEQLDAEVCDMRYVKPLDQNFVLMEAIRAGKLVVTLEDGIVSGGAGSQVSQIIAASSCPVPVLNIGIGDQFVEQGKPEELYHELGMDAEGIVRKIHEFMQVHEL
jgi:1-deoxy-D-xylulose-5-phosphate synthase